MKVILSQTQLLPLHSSSKIPAHRCSSVATVTPHQQGAAVSALNRWRPLVNWTDAAGARLLGASWLLCAEHEGMSFSRISCSVFAEASDIPADAGSCLLIRVLALFSSVPALCAVNTWSMFPPSNCAAVPVDAPRPATPLPVREDLRNGFQMGLCRHIHPPHLLLAARCSRQTPLKDAAGKERAGEVYGEVLMSGRAAAHLAWSALRSTDTAELSSMKSELQLLIGCTFI